MVCANELEEETCWKVRMLIFGMDVHHPWQEKNIVNVSLSTRNMHSKTHGVRREFILTMILPFTVQFG